MATPNLDELARRTLLGETSLDLEDRPTSAWLARMAADADVLPTAREMTRMAVIGTGLLTFCLGAFAGVVLRIVA